MLLMNSLCVKDMYVRGRPRHLSLTAAKAIVRP